jgi:uncharacterized protein (TIGR02996 family)
MHDAFLRDIRDNPDDDTMRLIYADWLDEQGDPRGEFIHVQMRLAGALPATTSSALRQREQELLRRHAVGWVGGKMSRLRRWVFRRGFLDEIELRADHFLADFGELLDREPVRCVRLRWATGSIAAISASPRLRTLRELDLSRCYLNDATAEVLAGSPHLDRLHALGLRSNFIRQRGAEALARSASLSRVQLLDLSGNLLTASARQALIARFGPAVRF